MSEKQKAAFLRRLRRAITDSEHRYVIFWTPSCAYSVNAIRLLREAAPGHFSSYSQKASIKQDLLGYLKMIGDQIGFDGSHTTWPIVFHDGKYLGGYTELRATMR